jgi:hypothetical protein
VNALKTRSQPGNKSQPLRQGLSALQLHLFIYKEALGKFPFPSFWTSQLSILERWFVPTRAFWVSQISQSHIIEI